MPSRIVVRPREYHDSVRLMRLSQLLRKEAGVSEAMIMMATPNNRKILETTGFCSEEARNAKPEDLIVAVTAHTEEEADAAIATAAQMLQKNTENAGNAVQAGTLDEAISLDPDINFACISVPGSFAADEAEQALERGLNVFLFSDNVTIEDEKRLKQTALKQNRLLMGPDCGTAIINGTAIGFANAVARGPVGIVAASGTGAQEISCLLDWMDVGISHIIGTGGRDLHQDIGGATMCQALELMAQDPQTDIIVVTSKPPSAIAQDRVFATTAKIGKPIVFNFLGATPPVDTAGAEFCTTLAETALATARYVRPDASLPCAPQVDREDFIRNALDTRKPVQRYVRGLYAGGTLCYEALLLLGDIPGGVYSNLKHDSHALTDIFASQGHTVIDMGDDAYTQGRAHPMIDPGLRNQRILHEAADPEVALLLLDLVIGYGAQDNPARNLAEILHKAREIAGQDGRSLPVIVTICGTRHDIQNYNEQLEQLEQAGVMVARSNAEAVTLAKRYVEAINV
ncbi:acyl-CoA synthetase FdrA [Komagataeibacter oboediens]